MRLWWQKQECNQVRHLLNGDGGFQTFRHEGKARGAFVSNDSIERAAIFCFHRVADEVRRDLAVRIKNVDENLFRIPLPDSGKVRTNVLAEIANTMASGARGLKNFPAKRSITFDRKRTLIFGNGFV